MPTPCRIRCLQTDPIFCEVERNLAAAEALLFSTDGKADLVVLPELFATGYAFSDAAEAHAFAEPFPDGPTIRRVAAWSRLQGGLVVAGYPERDGEAVYNAVIVAAGGRALLSARKTHLFGFEPRIYRPGAHAAPVIEHQGLRVGVMICFDWMYPEVARCLALEGADVIAHPSNLMLPWCQGAMPTRALENRLFTVTSNRVGMEHRPPHGPLAFTGRSLVCSPLGEVLAEGPPAKARVLELVVDLQEARDKRLPSGNDPLAERRPELYGPLVEPRP